MKHIILDQNERAILLKKIDLRLSEWIFNFPNSRGVKNLKKLKVEIGFPDIYLDTVLRSLAHGIIEEHLINPNETRIFECYLMKIKNAESTKSKEFDYLNTLMMLSNKFKKRGDEKHILL